MCCSGGGGGDELNPKVKLARPERRGRTTKGEDKNWGKCLRDTVGKPRTDSSETAVHGGGKTKATQTFRAEEKDGVTQRRNKKKWLEIEQHTTKKEENF